MEIKVNDIELYPNLFSLASINHKTKERELYWVCEGHNDIDKIIHYCLTGDMYVGYHSSKYDNLVLAYCLDNRKRFSHTAPLEIVKELKELSDEIIDGPRKWSDMSPRMKKLINETPFKYVDLLALFATIARTSLKQISINLQFHNVQSLPYPPDQWLTPEQIQEVLDYNFNDVEITDLLLEKKMKDLKLRKDIINRYGVDVLNDNDTGIAKKILNKYYEQYTGLKYSDFKDKRSYWVEFPLSELILRDYGFKTEPFKAMQRWFEGQKFNETITIKLETDDDENSYELKSQGLEMTIGLGGLHSKDKPGKFYTKDGRIIRDADVASLYPTIMINNQIKPRHCDVAFCRILETLVVERLADKAAGRKSEADTKKIVVNSIYGLLGSQYYWLRDNKALLTVTINGQLSLCRLVEDLQMAGIKVISVNTDGIVCDMDASQLDRYQEICAAWEKEFKYELEFVDYEMYIRKDVNNYISKTMSGKVKQKGKYFVTEIELHKGYWYPVIPQALTKYFLEGVKPEDFIKTNTKIYDFMCSQKADPGKFEMQFITLDNSGPEARLNREKLQKTNRWIVVNNGGKLVKVENNNAKENRHEKKRMSGKKISIKESGNKITHLDKDNYVQVTNRVLDADARKYDLKYQFYIDECWSVIRQIEPLSTQLTLL